MMSILLLGLIGIILAGAFVAGLFIFRQDSVEDLVAKNSVISTLLTIGENKQANTIELFLYHPGTKKGSLLFLPENLWSKIDSFGRYDKLDVLYDPGNAKPLIQHVEKLTGVRIGFAINISRDNLVKIVDLLGGISLYLPETLSQDAGTDMPVFNTKQALFDGEMVNEFLFGKPEAFVSAQVPDRKQMVIYALFAKIVALKESEYLKRDQAFDAFRRGLSTTFSDSELQTFISEISNMKMESVYLDSVHGRITANPEKGEIFAPNDQGDYLKLTMEKTMAYLTGTEAIRPEDLVVELEVLNGTKVNLLASTAARKFKQYQYEVLPVGNADRQDYPKTVIIARHNNLETAREAGNIIHCTNIQAGTEDPFSKADITIILGYDFDGEYCKK